MYFGDPAAFTRDCDLCRKYILDENGSVTKDATGAPIPQGKVDCSQCNRATMEFENGFEYGNHEIFRLYQLATAFGVLPRAGGLEDQTPDILEAFYQIGQIERDEEKRTGEGQSATMKRMFQTLGNR